MSDQAESPNEELHHCDPPSPEDKPQPLQQHPTDQPVGVLRYVEVDGEQRLVFVSVDDLAALEGVEPPQE